MDYFQRIRLFGEDYILIGTLESGAVIATEEQYINFDCAYAVLRADGKIMRFGEQIGNKEDIKLMPFEVKLEPTKEAWEKMSVSFENLAKWLEGMIND